MNVEQLFTNNNTLLFQQKIDGCLLEVKETEHYRWFEYNGHSIQSLMSKVNPKQVIMPVSQSLLLFLLLDNQHKKILNLGLGGASLERALVSIPNLHITAIEASQSIIDMAKHYFYLPDKVDVICQRAEQFVESIKAKYDVVLCDLFIGEKSPDFLFTEYFYKQLCGITTEKAVLSLNIKAQNNQQLLKMLLIIKKHFINIAIIEFDNYSNIVILCSHEVIPKQSVLQQRLANFTQIELSGLEKTIDKMTYIPINQ